VGLGIDRHIEQTIVHATFWDAALGPVGGVAQFRIGCDQTIEHATLDAHKAGRRFADFHESIGIDDQRYVFAKPAGVDGVAGIELLEALASCPVRDAVGWPVLALERIGAGGDIVIREQKPKRRFRRIADVRIDPEQMGELQVGEEICDAIVARPRDETIAVAEKEIEPLSGGKSTLPASESRSTRNSKTRNCRDRGSQ